MQQAPKRRQAHVEDLPTDPDRVPGDGQEPPDVAVVPALPREGVRDVLDAHVFGLKIERVYALPRERADEVGVVGEEPLVVEGHAGLSSPTCSRVPSARMV